MLFVWYLLNFLWFYIGLFRLVLFLSNLCTRFEGHVDRIFVLYVRVERVILRLLLLTLGTIGVHLYLNGSNFYLLFLDLRVDGHVFYYVYDYSRKGDGRSNRRW